MNFRTVLLCLALSLASATVAVFVTLHLVDKRLDGSAYVRYPYIRYLEDLALGAANGVDGLCNDVAPLNGAVEDLTIYGHVRSIPPEAKPTVSCHNHGSIVLKASGVNP